LYFFTLIFLCKIIKYNRNTIISIIYIKCKNFFLMWPLNIWKKNMDRVVQKVADPCRRAQTLWKTKIRNDSNTSSHRSEVVKIHDFGLPYCWYYGSRYDRLFVMEYDEIFPNFETNRSMRFSIETSPIKLLRWAIWGTVHFHWEIKTFQKQKNLTIIHVCSSGM